jgi:hypothetical protein
MGSERQRYRAVDRRESAAENQGDRNAESRRGRIAEILRDR